MKTSASTINQLYSQVFKMQQLISLTELRKSQEALSKAMKRKEAELEALELARAEKMVATPISKLSDNEIQTHTT